VRLQVGLSLVWAVACSSERRLEETLSIGADPVTIAMVQEVAGARGLPPLAAALAVAEDARFAHALTQQKPELASYLRRIALARATSLEAIRRAREEGVANDEELARFTALHWWELDRPVASRVTHVVVRVAEGEDRRSAEQLAGRLRHALEGARTPERFRQIAEAVDGGGFAIQVEDLKPVTPDGRVYDPAAPPRFGARPERYAPAFAEAANAISEVGKLSPVVETSYGFHVLLLSERLPDQRVAPEERRRRLHAEIESHRAREAERSWLEAMRASTPVEIDPAAMAHTEGLTVDR
jgi:hypothetical protein